MNIGKTALKKMNIVDASYPKWEIALAVALLYLAPFTTELLTYAVFAICLYRIVMYDARVFVTDYAILFPISQLFRVNQMSLLIYLCLIAAVWYFVTGKLEKKFSYAALLIFVNYLLLRMQWNISGFVLCAGQLFMLCVLLPKQDEQSTERAIKLFCLSLFVSSTFAFLLRDSAQLHAIRGSEGEAFWGSSLLRFYGLFEDPNYYMTLLVTAMAMLIRLMDCGKIKLIPFVLFEMAFAFFGAMTYSKTFFLLLLLLVVAGIVCLFQNKKYMLASVFIAVGLLAAWFVFSGTTIFSVVLFRFSSADSLYALTTGRSEVFMNYFRALTDTVLSLFFGAGLAANNLGKDPHNLYLEISYYLGIVGLILVVVIFACIVYEMKKSVKDAPKQKIVASNLPLVCACVLHFALHGLFSIISYAVFFFAILSYKIVKREVPQETEKISSDGDVQCLQE